MSYVIIGELYLIQIKVTSTVVPCGKSKGQSKAFSGAGGYFSANKICVVFFFPQEVELGCCEGSRKV